MGDPCRRQRRLRRRHGGEAAVISSAFLRRARADTRARRRARETVSPGVEKTAARGRPRDPDGDDRVGVRESDDRVFPTVVGSADVDDARCGNAVEVPLVRTASLGSAYTTENTRHEG